jgi:hypothetical protein
MGSFNGKRFAFLMGFPCLSTTANKAPDLLTNMFGFTLRQKKDTVEKLKLRWIGDN